MLSALYSSKRHNEEGFTLIELLVVVIIIGLLAAIALPIFLNQQKAAVDASVQSDVRNTVAQITGAQGLKSSTAEATISRAGTHLLFAAPSTAASADVTLASATLSGIPASGVAYTLNGYNAGGAKFASTSATFAYDGATGKFSTAAAPAAGDEADPDPDGDGGGTSVGGGSGQPTPAVITDGYDFESGAQGWYGGNSYVSAQAASLGGSSRLHFTTGGDFPYSGGAVLAPSGSAIEANKTYTVTADIYVDSVPATSKVRLLFGGCGDNVWSPDVTSRNSWQTATLTCTSQGDYSNYALGVFATNDNESVLAKNVDIYVDNVSVKHAP